MAKVSMTYGLGSLYQEALDRKILEAWKEDMDRASTVTLKEPQKPVFTAVPVVNKRKVVFSGVPVKD